MSCTLITVLLASSLHSPDAFADEQRESDNPFKIEDFSPKQGRFTLNSGIGYSVADSKDFNVAVIAVPFTHGILLYPDVVRENRRRDTVFGNLGIRYAATDRLNLSLDTRADASRTLIRENRDTDTESHTEHHAGFRTVSVGADYRITTAFQQPYIVGFANVAVLENSDGKSVHGRSVTVGISSNWAYDPA